MNATDLPIEMLEATSTQLAPTELAALALASSKTEAHLRTLATKHAGITFVTDKVAREQAHGAAMELTRARVQVEKVAKEARDGATKFSKAVITEEKRLIAIVEPEEARLKGLRDAWDDEQERIKREAEEKERARVLAITHRISEIKGYANLAMQCRTAERIKALIDKLNAYGMTGFEEFEAEAVQAHADTLKAMGEQHQLLIDREAEAERLKAEREELARQQAEAQRQTQELAAQQKAEADRLTAERAEFDRQQKEAADKLAAQLAEVERQKAEFAAQQAQAERKAREATEAVKATNTEASAEPAANVETLAVIEATLSPLLEAFDPAPTPQGADESIPSASDLVIAISDHYMVETGTVLRWLIARADEFKVIKAIAIETETA